ncbi:DUF4279 domain-containing protein [Candidatus Clostridium stratigraminis]|uniref:DUF4279 domain-containing protein n=1 Tax=Candidatus Clostridium stratigraminis TaxID=3381661 RepID=A0ABW8TBA6_9CLOT
MEKTKNSCYTYFAIKGNFNPDEITEILELTPSRCWKIGDKRPVTKSFYDFALWEYGQCDLYDVITENQMVNTIVNLKPKISLLKDIKMKYGVSFVLEVVPKLYINEPTPALAPSREIIKFCYETETDIDIDLYLFK